MSSDEPDRERSKSGVGKEVLHQINQRLRDERPRSHVEGSYLTRPKLCPIRPGVQLDATWSDSRHRPRLEGISDPDNANPNNIDVQIKLNAISFIVKRLLVEHFTSANVGLVLFMAIGYFSITALTGLTKLIFHHPLSPWILWYLFRLSAGYICYFAIGSIMATMESLEPRYSFKNMEDVIVTDSELKQIARRLPWSKSEPGLEEIRFLNKFLREMIPKVQILIESLLVKQFGEKEDDRYIVYESNYICINLKNTNIGNLTPSISGIRVFEEDPREDLIIDLETTIASNMNLIIEIDITLPANAGHFILRGGLQRLFLRGKLRIDACPLFNARPVVGGITLSLLDSPDIEWRFCGFLALLNVRPIKSIIKSLVNQLLLKPDRIHVNLAKYIPTEDNQFGDPVGVMAVRVEEVKNLTTDITLNVYVVVTVEADKKFTKRVLGNPNPTFDDRLVFMVHDTYSRVHFDVFSEADSLDAHLGRVSFPINHFTNPLRNGCKFRTQFYHPLVEELVDTLLYFQVNYSSLQTEMPSAISYDRNYPNAIVSVLVDSASNLHNIVSMETKTPELRTLVKVSLGNDTQVTTIKERASSPVWMEMMIFPIHDIALEDIRFEVLNMFWVMNRRHRPIVFSSKQKNLYADWTERATVKEGAILLGENVMHLSDIRDANHMRLEQVFNLEGTVLGATLRVTCEIRFLDFDKESMERNCQDDRQIVTFSKYGDDAIVDEPTPPLVKIAPDETRITLPEPLAKPLMPKKHNLSAAYFYQDKDKKKK